MTKMDCDGREVENVLEVTMVPRQLQHLVSSRSSMPHNNADESTLKPGQFLRLYFWAMHHSPRPFVQSDGSPHPQRCPNLRDHYASV